MARCGTKKNKVNQEAQSLKRAIFSLSNRVFYISLSFSPFPRPQILVFHHNILFYILELPGNIMVHCRYVRPGGGYVPNFQLFEKRDVNGEKEQKVFTFLKVSQLLT